ncbi:TonB-dependent receptor [Aliivibrio sp. S4TY2]|uniref:TonB-dependent receptor domain-containing protein n=1 Tax=unclassified Aliivibrio TaxID=2645654 RepID=UPI0023781A53|nr:MULTISPECIES: TonB-dependent receptor [unclassified Aliivibrio]MDD9157727.1 TonB-dependent receptor [Aliivibrio sp. S4TY2]MDD9161698.1 TonB-dependent receptor [Aliivibrio sp. S4TY1]MDD9165728.1 TonB-dependent receptor [Aliivibrio sp. S4MY2]MDD9169727.1 TonB-dependent receptor [Aliivibrio sp. S4MY4]MDD9186793.1 TonB-dependent receptor [Aliivibrio sp. S4MY3]
MKKTALATAIVSLLSHAYTSPVFAQNTTTETDETMVVTANRFEQSAKDVIAPMSVVTKEDIVQIQAKTMTDILRLQPGIEVASNGGIGQNASIFMRGTNSDHVLILIDGFRMNSSIKSGMNINKIPVNQVERIEIIRGSGAVMYGSDAVGGVINIITRTSSDDLSKSATIGAGSNKYKEGNFAANTNVGESGHLKMAAGFTQTEGYNVNPQPELNDGDKHGFENSQFMLNYDHQLSSYVSLFTGVRWFNSTSEYNHYTNTKSRSESESTVYSSKLSFHKDVVSSELSISYQDDQTLEYHENGDLDSEQKIDQLNMQWTNQIKLADDWLVNAGVDWTDAKVKADITDWSNKVIINEGESRASTGVYLGTQYQLEQLKLEANTRFDKHDKYDEYTTWGVGASYQINDIYKVSSAYNTAFKAPSFYDLSTAPDLEPETSKNIDVSLAAAYNLVDVNLSLYKNSVDNLIVYYDAPNFAGYSANVDADIKGAELELLFDTGIVSHTLIAEYKDHEDTEGQQLARRAKQNYKWIGSMGLGDLDLNLSYIYTGKRSDLPSAPGVETAYLDPYSLWSVAAAYWVTSDLAIRGRVENLLDEEYETAGGYKPAERSYYVSLDYQF